MHERNRFKSFSFGVLLVVMAACVFCLAQLAWASDDESRLTSGSVALQQPEGQNGVLANSWRFRDGLPMDGLARSEGESPEVSLSAQGALATQTSKNHFGVDVSEHQGDIDWAAAADMVEYAIVRCGYGDDIASQDDKRWLANVKGCKDAGIPMGVYLYSYATDTTMAASEAQHVVRCMKEAGLGESDLSLPIYLDMEDDSTTGADHEAIFEMFKSTLAAHGYGNVGIYANCNWWSNYLSDIQLDSSLRWVAHWGVDDPFDGYEDLQSKGYGVWQYGIASASGVSGSVDGNYLNDDAVFSGAMFRLYNPNSGEHFYTAAPGELANLVQLGWRYEGLGWHAPSASEVPVYRLYNSIAGEHHYTISAAERDMLVDAGWNDEGIGWHSDDAERVPLYREYNPNAFANNHNYTTSIDEHKFLISLGWKDEGIAWYGV